MRATQHTEVGANFYGHLPHTHARLYERKKNNESADASARLTVNLINLMAARRYF